MRLGLLRGVALLLATGDSFTYGAEAADADTWPARLQGLLHLRVANGGVPGYGLDQIVLRSERLQRGHRRRMAGEHAEIALGPRHVDLIDFAGEEKLFGRDEIEVEGRHEG